MTSSEFVDNLKLIAPSEKSLVEQGLKKDFIENYLDGYNLKMINSETVTDDPLLDLIYKYDISNLDIGMIRFENRDDIMDTGRFILFGSYDADVVAIDKITNEVVVLDWEEESRIMGKCSKDTETFLSALLKVAEFNEKMSSNDNLLNDQDAIKNKAREIASTAGGENYIDFYLNILGYEG
ncbi:hypothetical protein WIW50_10130 [Flavobacteriaceae bacterium 3-367]